MLHCTHKMSLSLTFRRALIIFFLLNIAIVQCMLDQHSDGETRNDLNIRR